MRLGSENGPIVYVCSKEQIGDTYVLTDSTDSEKKYLLLKQGVVSPLEPAKGGE